MSAIGGRLPSESLNDGIQVAEVYSFTERLTSPYRLAYRQIKSSPASVVTGDVNGENNVEVLPPATYPPGRSMCFSPEGSTVYYGTGSISALDLHTHETRSLIDLQNAPACISLHHFECSPDNQMLCFAPFVATRKGTRYVPIAPFRLCRVSTTGSDFHVLYEDPSDYQLHSVSYCWRRGFALLVRMSRTRTHEPYEWCKVSLESGDFTLLGRHEDLDWEIEIHPDGEQIAWSSFDHEIYHCSLKTGTTPRLICSGCSPAWSPDGSLMAFMDDQHCLSLYHTADNRTQPLIWFKPAGLPFRVRKWSYACQPRWSPDGRMLWFRITQTLRPPAPRSIPEAFEEVRRAIIPYLHNLNPKRTSHHSGYNRQCHRWRQGIVDLSARQIHLSARQLDVLSWLP